LAEVAGIRPDHVSTVLCSLERRGLITIERAPPIKYKRITVNFVCDRENVYIGRTPRAKVNS
jgi:hypothetical protein